MKNKILLSLLMLTLVGCNKQTFDKIIVENVKNNSEISSFNLISPANGTDVVKDIPTFEWESANNATSYIVEISSNSTFDSDDGLYFRKTGIVDTKYIFDTYLRNKEVTYYWRVFAKNNAYEVLCNDEYRAFYLTSPDFGEIEFNIDYADEWLVHEQGSQCNVSVDKSDFFNNGKNSLMIDFTSEQTNVGKPESDGWIVVTHPQETELYGVDAFYFNFYYNGQDSNIFLRVIDEDNEYYNAEIKLATNAQQTIIMKFDEFTLRTKGGTPIINQKFDYNYIKAVELVFEQTFGDGICIISDLKAIHFDDYQYLFVSKVNFNDFNSEEFVYDNYKNFVPVVTDEGKTMTISYGGDINGYGFLKIPVNKTLVNGNAFKVKISHTGSSTHKILFRIIEEDSDRWVYRQNCNTLIDDYLIIPFTAFTLSEANGDGARQFYFIKQFQFGVESAYGAGSTTYSDMSICYLEDEVDGLYQNQIASDGSIEDFERYDTTVQMYYKWQSTVINKDESMALDSQYTPNGIGQSGKFTYKSDMYPAVYGLMFDNSVEGFNGLSFEALDKSILKNPTTSSANPFAHLGNGEAKMIITIYVTNGETYSYVIDKLSQSWIRYNISFNDFTLDPGFSEFNATKLESENIIGLRFDIQFYYYLSNGIPYPQYQPSNPVYLDNIKLINTTQTVIEDATVKIKPSESDPNITVLEDFENGNAFTKSALEYCSMEIVNENNNNIMKFGYKGNSDSVAYTKNLNLDKSCSGKAIELVMKGDSNATVYFNIYFEYAGTVYKYRASITGLSENWQVFTIGFNNFTKLEGTGNVALSSSRVPNITKISFGIVNYKNYNIDYIYVDEIRISNNASYTVNTVTAL